MNNPLLNESIGVHFLDMDPLVDEQVTFNPDGSFSIIINARLSWDRQMLAYCHAIQHIMGADFDKESADQIEKEMID